MQARLGVTTRRGAEVRRSVVAVEIDEWMTQREWLRHADECVVNRGVAMGVIAGHGVACDARALHKWAVRTETLLFHVPNDAAVHRLQAVAHIRERARHDDRHRVIKERAFHFVLQRDWLDRIGSWCVAHSVFPFVTSEVEVAHVACVCLNEVLATFHVIAHQHAHHVIG